jgi:hypothetical protein
VFSRSSLLVMTVVTVGLRGESDVTLGGEGGEPIGKAEAAAGLINSNGNNTKTRIDARQQPRIPHDLRNICALPWQKCSQW